VESLSDELQRIKSREALAVAELTHANAGRDLEIEAIERALHEEQRSKAQLARRLSEVHSVQSGVQSCLRLRLYLITP
jgi:predicted RNase H-like nuclease (RuvC/YqgF family)